MMRSTLRLIADWAVFLSISSDAATNDANDLVIVRIRAVFLSISSDDATDAALDLAHERTRAVHPVTALRAVWKAEVWCLTAPAYAKKKKKKKKKKVWRLINKHQNIYFQHLFTLFPCLLAAEKLCFYFLFFGVVFEESSI
jgi:hypothetical protein